MLQKVVSHSNHLEIHLVKQFLKYLFHRTSLTDIAFHKVVQEFPSQEDIKNEDMENLVDIDNLLSVNMIIIGIKKHTLKIKLILPAPQVPIP